MPRNPKLQLEAAQSMPACEAWNASHALMPGCMCSVCAGLVQMLYTLAPTVTGYYKGDLTVRDKKFAHDREAAAAARTAKQQDPPSSVGNPSS